MTDIGGTRGDRTARDTTARGRAERGRTRVDLESVAARFDAADAAAAALAMAPTETGTRGAGAGAGEGFRQESVVAAVIALVASVGDVPVLLGEVRAARSRAANLAAAGRATLAAARDGEADPLYYLRDELAVTP